MSKIGQAALWSPEEAGVLDYLPSKEKDCQSQNLQTKIQPSLLCHDSVPADHLGTAGHNKNDPVLARIAARVYVKARGDDGADGPGVLTQDKDAKIFFLFLAGSKIASS